MPTTFTPRRRWPRRFVIAGMCLGIIAGVLMIVGIRRDRQYREAVAALSVCSDQSGVYPLESYEPYSGEHEWVYNHLPYSIQSRFAEWDTPLTSVKITAKISGLTDERKAAALRALASRAWPKLKSVELEGFSASVGPLIKPGCTSLNALDLYRMDLASLGDHWLPECPALVHLCINQTTLGPTGLAALARARHLHGLHLHDQCFNDASLFHLRHCPDLKTLMTGPTGIRGPGLAALAGCAHLERLFITAAPMDDGGLKHLPPLPSLQLLALVHSGMPDGAIDARRFPRLNTIFANQTRLGDAFAASLADHPQLQELEMADTALSDDGIRELARLPALQWLDVRGCDVSDAALAPLLVRGVKVKTGPKP